MVDDSAKLVQLMTCRDLSKSRIGRCYYCPIIDQNGNLVNEDLTNKKTLVVFWADYWGICREELPLLEANLAAVSQNYDVIALAHSDVDSTMTWVSENLKGEITIGFSTSDMRDNLKIIGQPISLIIDTDGNILSREYGYVPNDL